MKKSKALLLKKIKEYDTIIIHGHQRPDGDCYGAQFGLKNIIKESFPNKKVYVVGQKSEYVDFVGKIDVIDDKEYEGALSVIVDTATESRISDPRYKLGKETFKVDHHIPGEDSYYADYYWVDTSKPSCAQMIADFYSTYSKKLKLNHEGAQAMYVGILTDTGRFRYRGVDNQTHKIAGMLLDFDIDVEYVDYQLSIQSLAQIELKGHVLTNFKYTEGGFVYFLMTKEIIEKYGLTSEEASAAVNNLAGIEGYPVWALFIESDDEIRIRLRSNGPEIQSIALKYGGGGHEKAAGARIDNLTQIDQFAKDIDEHIKKYLEENEDK